MRKLKTVSVLTIGLCLLFVGGTAVSVYTFAQKDETRPADAAIVLGAAVFGNRPSPVLRERINHAITLYEQGIVSTIIFTGGVGYRDTLSEARVSANYAIAQGIPTDAILLEDQSTSTRENLINVQSIAADHNLHSFLIVSTPFHMKRALSLADDLNMTAYSSPTRTTRWINRQTKFRSYLREVAAYQLYLLFDV
ncbi:MAG: YdcF family protein [Anaerolineales bacterium]|nr:YdcF family protein [Anaerolineales bacterium]